MKTLYIIRHGETDGNAGHVWQTPHTPLSDGGRKQAQALGERFKNIQIDCILHSPYTRAHETADAIHAATGKPLVMVDEMHERLRPSVIRGKPQADPEAKKVMEHVTRTFYHDDATERHSDEEGFFDLRRRAEKIITIFESRSEQHIAAVSHRDTISFIVGSMLFRDEFSPLIYECLHRRLVHANTGITKCTYTDHGWKVLTWSDDAHLG
ncbi:MAG: hypothetical protein RI911_267 [Candidatus Parcubacteria bacterium]|jgi:probable phosphoglycerate mutase